MRRVILSLLILALLSTGIVWAADTHAGLLPEHTATTSDCLYDAPMDDTDHHQSHGCHMSSHLLAMASVRGELRPSSHDSYSPTVLQDLISRHSAPPIRPPRV